MRGRRLPRPLRAAIGLVALKIHALAVALGARRARVEANAVHASTLTALGHGAPIAALAAVIGIRVEIDAAPLTPGLRAGEVAFGVEALAVGACLTRAARRAVSAVFGIAEQVCAVTAAFEGVGRAALTRAVAVDAELTVAAAYAAPSATAVRAAGSTAAIGLAHRWAPIWLGRRRSTVADASAVGLRSLDFAHVRGHVDPERAVDTLACVEARVGVSAPAVAGRYATEDHQKADGVGAHAQTQFASSRLNHCVAILLRAFVAAPQEPTPPT